MSAAILTFASSLTNRRFPPISAVNGAAYLQKLTCYLVLSGRDNP
jgi:hypothetical protein